MDSSSPVPHDGHGGHPHHHGSISPLRRLLQLVRPDARDIRDAISFAVGVGILSLATPLAIEAVVATVAMSLLVQQLVVVSLILLVCLGFAACLRALQTYVAEIIQRRIFVRVATDLAYRLPRVRADAYDHDYGPELVNRFFDVMTVQKVGALLLLDGVAIVLQSVIGLMILAFYHPYLLGFDLAILSAMVFAVVQLGRGAIATSIQESRTKYAAAEGMEELARCPVTFKHHGGLEHALRRAETDAKHYLTARQQHFRILMRQIVFALAFQAIATTALLGLGGWLVIDGQLTLGQLVAAELIVVTVVSSFAKLGKHLEGWYDLMAAVDKLGHLIDLPLERFDGEEHRRIDAPAWVRLRGVSFGYPGRAAVLRDLNLDIKPGTRAAIVGSSGSGKSSFADMLFGLRSPTSGWIELDGINLRDLRLDDLREHVALVKGIDVLEGTILENVRLGRDELGLDQIRDALDQSGVLEELADLPEGLHTRLAPNGAPLSRGQIRRLILARAIVGQPRLLIIDETLDGMDWASRDRALEALLDRSAPWTLLLITNDPSTAQRCDRIIDLNDGDDDDDGKRSGRGPAAAPALSLIPQPYPKSLRAESGL